MMMMKVDWNVSHFLAAHLKKSTANSTFLVPIFFQVRSVIPEVLAARRPCFKWNTPLQKLALRCWNPKGWCKALGRPWPLDVKHGSWWFSWWFFMVISWWFHGDFTVDDDFHDDFVRVSWWFPGDFPWNSSRPPFVQDSSLQVAAALLSLSNSPWLVVSRILQRFSWSYFRHQQPLLLLMLAFQSQPQVGTMWNAGTKSSRTSDGMLMDVGFMMMLLYVIVVS